MLFAAASLSFCAALIAVSCGPLGDDDDEPAVGESDNSEVVQSTYTPTVPGSTPEAIQTLEAAQTAAVMTATEQALNPPPGTAIAGNPDDGTASPDGTSDGSGSSSTSQPPIGGTDDDPTTPDTPSDALQPPSAALVVGADQIEGALGPYSWQWDDAIKTFFEVPASPLMEVSDVALTIQSGAEAEIAFAGDALQEPPDAINIEIYDFDENTAIPYDQSGTTLGEGLAFAPKVDPITTLQPDPANPATFTADFAPGHYVLYMRAEWPEPAELTKPGGTIYVTYTFNLIVE